MQMLRLVAAPHPNPLPTEEWGEGIRNYHTTVW
jgi:hypothetical protein